MTPHDQASPPSDTQLLEGTTAAVEAAGRILLDRFSASHRIDDRDALLSGIAVNDSASEAILRPALELLRPQARWDDDEEGSGRLGEGEWWVTDAAEGNVNHIHGLPGWAVTATLVRDDQPVVTAVHLPLTGQTYSATRGHGAFLNGRPLAVSSKSDLSAALVGTGQAKPGEDRRIRHLLSRSFSAMLDHALLVSAAVPSTIQLLPVAEGHTDGFWQYGQIRSGLVAGALLVQEAGGVVLDTRGAPWTLASDDFVATTPGLATALTSVLYGAR